MAKPAYRGARYTEVLIHCFYTTFHYHVVSSTFARGSFYFEECEVSK